jgi:phage shock protein A
MGFLQKTRTVVMAHMNELVDKAIDINSIPVLKQGIRDLEDALASQQHQANIATAQIATLTRDKEAAFDSIVLDKRRAQAFLTSTPPNENAAREVAGRIADQQQIVTSLTAQIETAKQQSQSMQAMVEKMRAKHDSYLSRVRALESTDRSTKFMEQSSASMKQANAVLGVGVDHNVDDVASRINARHDVAEVEFQQTAADMNDGPEDPLKKQAVDDILADLKGQAQTAA